MSVCQRAFVRPETAGYAGQRGRRTGFRPYTLPTSSLAGSNAMDETFEAGLTARVDAMLDACTRCGKCVEACPITDAAGVADQPRDVITGVIDILRGADGAAAARAWADPGDHVARLVGHPGRIGDRTG